MLDLPFVPPIPGLPPLPSTATTRYERGAVLHEPRPGWWRRWVVRSVGEKCYVIATEAVTSPQTGAPAHLPGWKGWRRKFVPHDVFDALWFDDGAWTPSTPETVLPPMPRGRGGRLVTR